MLVVSYGGGTNSKALIIEFVRRGIKPDLILFANTGGELPETYADIAMTSAWLESKGFPQIKTVVQVDKNGDENWLYEWCIANNVLPSVAYGFKSCSQKHKIAPQEKFMNNYLPAAEVWKAGNRITKVVGYDVGESHRTLKDYSDEKYVVWYPLVEWGWDRDRCEAEIIKENLPLPGKSACFFCPNTSEQEIIRMRYTHPDLIAKAIFMEDNATDSQVVGLGRRFSWKSVIEYYDKQGDFFGHLIPEKACGCTQ